MHSGFLALRRHMPFNVRRSSPGKGRGPGVAEDVARITAIWRECRSRFGGGGVMLFGRFSIADAFYAPVVSRFTTYAVDVDPVCARYMEAVWALPSMQAWKASAIAETHVSPAYDL
jgi:glutathione S-transferase